MELTLPMRALNNETTRISVNLSRLNRDLGTGSDIWSAT